MIHNPEDYLCEKRLHSEPYTQGVRCGICRDDRARVNVPMTGRGAFGGEFSGITQVVTFPNHQSLVETLTWLASGCGEQHRHNVGVAFDGNRLYGSDLAMVCAERYGAWKMEM